MKAAKQPTKRGSAKCLILTILVLLLSSQISYSQNFERCGTDPAPAEMERWIQPLVEQYKQMNINQRVVTTLPIVFHIIHDGEAIGTGANISAAQIESQVEVLNEDFRKLGAGANTHPDGADAMIEFCLAAINRVDRNDEGFSAAPYTSCYIDETIKPATIWDPDEFINTWVISQIRNCAETKTLLGYSTWPESSGLTGVGTNNGVIEDEDGVVIKSSSTGRPPANPNGGAFNLGRTLTHELGHFFGLRHTWGDGDCSADDYCNDTPNCSDPFYGCSVDPAEDCTDAGARMIENYLDYSDDDCMNIFTDDQSARMQAVLANSPRRNTLSAASCCEGGFASASASNYRGFGVSCNGGSDGIVTASTTGGTAPYTYLWGSNAGNATTVSVSGLGFGTYEVTITDGSGCEASASVSLTQPTVLNATGLVKSNYNGEDISCFGGSDGVAEVQVTGGVPPYDFLWSNGQTTVSATGLSATTYTVVVTDANGCTDNASVTLTQPPNLNAGASISSDYNGQDISCFGASDGAATASATGGVAPYSYSWSNGQAAQVATGLDATTYTVVVTDANGCTDNASVTLTQPPNLNAGASISSDYNGQDISCFGASDGAATASATGGVLPYTYSWSNGQATQVATGLDATTYTVLVTDANGCTDDASVTLTQPAPVTAVADAISDYNGWNISCFGAGDGIAEVIPGGGTAPYSYQWDANAGNQTTAIATGLTAGSFFVTVTDVNGCTESTSVTLFEPPALTISAGSNQTVYFGYPPAGCATLSWSGEGGGVPPYTITWSDGGSQTHDVCPETTTTYTVTIVDLNGCVETDEVIVCAIDVRCGKKLDKVEICHVDDEGNEHTLCVGFSSVASHLAHNGDMLAACGTDHNCPPVSLDGRIFAHGAADAALSAYPNPFDRSSIVSFSSSTAGPATMRLVDMTGVVVMELFNGTITSDLSYQVDVSSDKLTSGMYFCVLQLADGTVRTVELVIMK